jgi:hypothetical protein
MIEENKGIVAILPLFVWEGMKIEIFIPSHTNRGKIKGGTSLFLGDEQYYQAIKDVLY